MTLKYQGTFARAARECSVVDGNMVMKIGVEGRLIVGPAGGPGQVDVPLRFAVVMETPSASRAIATKFVIVPVQVGAGVGNLPFTHVEEAMTFPVPTPARKPRQLCSLYRLRSGYGRGTSQTTVETKAETKVETEAKASRPRELTAAGAPDNPQRFS